MYDSLQCENFCGSAEACVLAIGIFDAVHLGHLEVLRQAKEFANEKKAKLFAFTFFPHPAKVILRAGNSGDLIYSTQIREKLLKRAGVDAVFFKEFNLDFASISPEKFILFLREKFPNFLGIVIGENFKFGAKTSADIKWLKENSKKFNFEARSAKGVLQNNEYVSSTRLRKALKDGDMAEFERLSGKPYFAEGVVEKGKQLGRTIGFATLNIAWNPECKMPFGSYVVKLTNLTDSKIYDGVANFGINPTVENKIPHLETHLFESPDFSEGTEIKVELLSFIRAEQKFEDLEELKSAIASDKAKAIAFLKNAKK